MNRSQEDFNEEIAAHIALEADQLVAEGMSRKDAMIAARRSFGNVMKREEQFYESSRWMWLDHLVRDTRHALRQMRRAPMSTATIVLSLTLGIGFAAATFSLADQALLRALPVRAPESLAQLEWDGSFVVSGMGSVGHGSLIPFPLYRDLAADNDVFESMFARAPAEVHLAVGEEPEPVLSEIVTGSYFPTLGVLPALGRLLGESDDVHPGAHPLAVLSYDYWQNRLGGDPGVVGREIRLNNQPMTVIGVAQAGFHGTDWSMAPAVWIPMMMKGIATAGWTGFDEHRSRFAQVYARLLPGVDRATAMTRIAPWFHNYLRADTELDGWPAVNETQLDAFMASRLMLRSGTRGQSRMGRQLQQPLLILAVATALILLLTCLNVANLSLAQALKGRRATALRCALGASRRRIVAEKLIQSGLLAVSGCLAGALLAPVASRGIISFLPQEGEGSVALSPNLDPRALGMALAVTALVTLLSGAAPAFFAASVRPINALKQSTAGVVGGLGIRRALVVGQFTLALVLLVAAGLFAQTLGTLRAQGPGFATKNLLMFRVMPPSDGYTVAATRPLIQRLVAAIQSLPDVESAGVTAFEMLIGGGWNNPITLGATEPIRTDRSIPMNAVSPDFFDALGAKLLRGRGFTDRDRAEEGWNLRSVIVNEEMVRLYLSDQDPIGMKLAFGTGPDAVPEIEIVGIVQNVQDRGLREPEPHLYFALWERYVREGTFYIRTRADAATVAHLIRETVRDVDPALTIRSLRTLDDQLDRLLKSERMLATLAVVFAIVATLLALIGLYGVLTFSAELRTKEMGLRLALGAPRWSVGHIILREAMTLAGMGLVLALPVCWVVGRLIEAQLYGVRSMDPSTILTAAAVFVAVCLIASAVPARRVVSLDPLRVLRSD